MSTKRTNEQISNTSKDTDKVDPLDKKAKVDALKEWRVDILQIPCNKTGDCSIHVLLSKDPSAAVWMLEKAVLMDGGNTSTSVVIPVVLQKYKENTSIDIKKFDAWIVTHWDGDHYEGSVTWLKDNKSFLTKDTKYYCPDYGFTFTGASPKTRSNPPPRAKTSLKALFDMEKAVDAELEKKWIHDVTNGQNNLIGLDFFTGDRLFDITDADPLKTISKRENAARPVMACFGSNANIATGGCKDGVPISYMNAGSSISKYVNKCSVITLTLFPQRFAEGGSQKATWYGAGDGCMETELLLLKYFKTKGVSVEALKATHHGSTHEFNKEWFLQCKPKYWLVSPGSCHGHPTAHVLLQLAELMCQHPFKVYPSRMLYWYREKVDEKSVNEQDFVEELQDYKKTANLEKLSKERNDKFDQCTRAYDICTVLASLGLAEQTPLGDEQVLTMIDTPSDDWPPMSDEEKKEFDKLPEAERKKQEAETAALKEKMAFKPGYCAYRPDKETKITKTDEKNAAQARRVTISLWGESLWNLLTDGIVADTYNKLLERESNALKEAVAKLPVDAPQKQKDDLRKQLDSLPKPSAQFPYWLQTVSGTKDATDIKTDQAGEFRS